MLWKKSVRESRADCSRVMVLDRRRRIEQKTWGEWMEDKGVKHQQTNRVGYSGPILSFLLLTADMHGLSLPAVEWNKLQICLGCRLTSTWPRAVATVLYVRLSSLAQCAICSTLIPGHWCTKDATPATQVNLSHEVGTACCTQHPDTISLVFSQGHSLICHHM